MSQQVHGRIEITQWRELFDEEDALTIEVYAVGDPENNLTIIEREQNDLLASDADPDEPPETFGFVWDNAEAEKPQHKGIDTYSEVIADG